MTRDIYVKKQQSAKTISQTKILWVTTTINSQSIIVLERDSAGHVTRCKGTVSITGAGAGYAKGCIYIKTDATGEGFFRNVGTTASCTFEALDTISATEIALTDGEVLIWAVTNKAAWKAVTGDVTITREGVTSIGADKVVTAKILDANVTLAKIENVASARLVVWNGSNRPTAVDVTGDVTITNAWVTAIGNNKVLTAMINDANVTLAKVENVTSGRLVVGNASDRPTAVDVTWDVTISNAWVTTIGAWKVTPAMTAQTQDRTATNDGLTDGIIAETAKHVTVTSGDANHIITLPAPVVWKVLTIDVWANGFKLQTTAPATIAINGGVGASAVSAIAADSTCYLICVSATAWKGFFMDADSDVAKIPAAA